MSRMDLRCHLPIYFSLVATTTCGGGNGANKGVGADESNGAAVAKTLAPQFKTFMGKCHTESCPSSESLTYFNIFRSHSTYFNKLREGVNYGYRRY